MAKYVCFLTIICYVKEGDTIEIDIPNASIHLAVSDDELAARKAAYIQPEPNIDVYKRQFQRTAGRCKAARQASRELIPEQTTRKSQ